MTLEEQIEYDLTNIHFREGYFAKLVVVESEDGNDVYRDVRAIIEYGTGGTYGGTNSIHEEAVISLVAADVPYIKKGDKIIVGEVTWVVDMAQPSGDSLTWEVTAEKK